jgi:hypothetical protein
VIDRAKLRERHAGLPGAKDLIRTYQRHRDDIVVGRIGGAGLQLPRQAAVRRAREQDDYTTEKPAGEERG